jgi:hypothetical protein
LIVKQNNLSIILENMNRKAWCYWLVLFFTTAMLSSFPSIAKALTFGEALGVGAGVLLLDRAVDSNRQRYRFVPPEEEFRRGVEDGFNRARYDNPRDSRDYDDGFMEGRRRANQGWRTPFSQ